MYKFLTKNGQLVAFGLGLVLVLVFYLIATSGMEAFDAVPEKERPGSEEGNIFLFGLYAAVFLMVLCWAGIIIFGLIQTATNLKAAKNSLIGLVVIGIIFFATYSMANPADDAPIQDVIQQFEISEGVSKYISAAISTTGILALLAVVSFVFSEIRNFFK